MPSSRVWSRSPITSRTGNSSPSYHPSKRRGRPRPPTDFPRQDPYQNVKAQGADAFVLRMPASGASLTWSTYLGANGTDVARCVVEGRNGSTWIGGDTTSTDFPVVVTAPSRSDSPPCVSML